MIIVCSFIFDISSISYPHLLPLKHSCVRHAQFKPRWGKAKDLYMAGRRAIYQLSYSPSISFNVLPS